MAATEELLVTKGRDVSTKAIAEAAGIAEGTIFRVFPTKDAIIDAIFMDATDPEGCRAEFAELSEITDLEECLVAMVAILQRRIARVLALFGVVGFRRPLSFEDAEERRDTGLAAIADLLRPHKGRLLVSPEIAAQHVQGVIMAHTHPMMTKQPLQDAEMLVRLALHGVAAPSKTENAS